MRTLTVKFVQIYFSTIYTKPKVLDVSLLIVSIIIITFQTSPVFIRYNLPASWNRTRRPDHIQKKSFKHNETKLFYINKQTGLFLHQYLTFVELDEKQVYRFNGRAAVLAICSWF